MEKTQIKELRCPHIKDDGNICGRLLLKYVGYDIGRIQIKCVRCKTIFEIVAGDEPGGKLTAKELIPAI